PAFFSHIRHRNKRLPHASPASTLCCLVKIRLPGILNVSGIITVNVTGIIAQKIDVHNTRSFYAMMNKVRIS
ncbi:MAG TPA: hypothetical protein PLB79_03860, partial [Thermotogota bacterium]|nr:hypothetical protein [Thermotogota bacterium]